MKYRSLLIIILVAQVLIACGAATPEPTAAPAVPSTDLSAIKTYLTDKTNQLTSETTSLEQAAQRYYDLANARQFNYATLWSEDRDATVAALADARSAWLIASPAYEQMEGIVAGVPALAQFDVDLDAGTSGQETEGAVSFDLVLPDGTTLPKPGNLFGVLESTLWGTYAEYTISAVDADLNGNGKVEFGEGLPEANVLLGGAQKLHATAKELQAAALDWTPSVESAFNALVVMIPTMNEYFESWKNSRFVAGADSDQRDFVAISRLADVQNILGSLQVVYTSVQPLVAEQDPAQAAQIDNDLAGLKAFVADVYAQEQSGERFTPEEADLLGAEAQDRATAITGNIAQMAGMLNIPLSE